MKATCIYPFIITGGVLQTCGARHERATEQGIGQSVVSQYGIVCHHHGILLLRVCRIPHALAECPRSRCHAVVGASRRFGRGRSGVRRPDSSQQSRRWTLCRLHRDGGSDRIFGCRSLRTVSYAHPPCQYLEGGRSSPHGWRNCSDREVLNCIEPLSSVSQMLLRSHLRRCSQIPGDSLNVHFCAIDMWEVSIGLIKNQRKICSRQHDRVDGQISRDL